MKIAKLFLQKQPVVSFEIFPPKPDSPFEPILSTIRELEDLGPDFISVTYGAGGTTQGRTIEIAENIKKRNDCQTESLAHLTCITNTADETEQMLLHIKNRGIENILALRGDPPVDQTVKTNKIFAKDLVEQIKKIGGFCIGAAAYPEGHPECSDRKQELEFLITKINAGVDFLITQIFFDNKYFYELQNNLEKNNITTPLSAGIMPVFAKSQIERICSLCGCTITPEIRNLMDKYGANPADMEKAGLEYACKQIEDLCNNKVRGIHLYTMNKPSLAKAIVKNTNLR